MSSLAAIYSGLPDGYEVSRAEIAKEKLEGNYAKTEGLGYGEVDLDAFDAFLRATVPAPGKLEFADLGSGTGKAVLVAAAQFGSSVGVELLRSLHAVAEQALAQSALENVTLIAGDMFDHVEVWARAHVLFITCTLFSDEMMTRVGEYVRDHVQHDALVMCTTRKLKQPGLVLVKEARIKYAKGSLVCFVYRRHRPPLSPPASKRLNLS